MVKKHHQQQQNFLNNSQPCIFNRKTTHFPLCYFLRLHLVFRPSYHERRMDSAFPTPTVGSTICSSSSVSTQIPSSPPLLFLEVSLISAQDLTPVSKSTRTYAVAWINPNRKFTTRTDHHCTNPTWNDKLTFRVDSQFLVSAYAVINVEIYTVSWFRHVLVGTVRVLISDILGSLQKHPKNTRFVVLQVRRPSGTPQGILNMGVTLLDNSLKSMLRKHQAEDPPKKVNDPTLQQQKAENQEDEDAELVKKVHLWRSMSVGSEMNNSDQFPLKEGSVCNGSVCNGSVVNGSELCSDIGPSASIVAADIARKMQPLPAAKLPYKNTQDDETGSSIVEELTFEEAIAKGYKNRATRDSWKKAIYHYDESEISYAGSRHERRNSDGSLFSCFVGGVEFTIVCGASNKPSSNKYSNSMSRRRNKSTTDLS